MLTEAGGGMILSLMAMPYLMGCKGCLRETGKYEVKLDLAGFRDLDHWDRSDETNDDRGWRVALVVLYRSPKKALALSQGDVITVQGKTQSMSIDEGAFKLFIE